MLCLGIESTAHTFGAAIVHQGENCSQPVQNRDHTLKRNLGHFTILSDVKDVYKAAAGSGIHPRDASRHHVLVSANVIEQAFRESGMGIRDLDCIAYSAGPGLGPCLRVGAVVARTLSSFYGKPLVPTNHAIGHIELGKQLTDTRDPLVLLISGGHTAIAAFIDGNWRILGETLDLTLGQLLDQLGRFFGLASPAGVEIERFALDGSSDGISNLPDLPYIVKGNDVSYSGLLSAAKRLRNEGISKERVAFGVQEVGFSMLVEATERALAFSDKKELLVTGGVAANLRLSEMLSSMCTGRRVKLGIIPKKYSGDCGSQIAAIGMARFKNGIKVRPRNAFIRQSWRIDRAERNS